MDRISGPKNTGDFDKLRASAPAGCRCARAITSAFRETAVKVDRHAACRRRVTIGNLSLRESFDGGYGLRAGGRRRERRRRDRGQRWVSPSKTSAEMDRCTRAEGGGPLEIGRRSLGRDPPHVARATAPGIWRPTNPRHRGASAEG